jgi:hypothetical protein
MRSKKTEVIVTLDTEQRVPVVAVLLDIGVSKRQDVKPPMASGA